jgi:hypothetical protein
VDRPPAFQEQLDEVPPDETGRPGDEVPHPHTSDRHF